MSSPPAPRASGLAPAAQRCATRLRQLITSGALGPGEQLGETALAARLEVSRNTLREGFRELAQQGLVQHHPHRGVFVTAPTAQDVRRLYTGRRALECGVLLELAGSGAPVPPQGLVALRAQTEQARDAASRQDWVTVGDLNMQVHAGMVALAGSPTLDAACSTLLAHARLAFRSLALPEQLHAHFVEANHALVDLLVQGRWEAAATDLRGYLHRAEAEVLDELG